MELKIAGLEHEATTAIPTSEEVKFTGSQSSRLLKGSLSASSNLITYETSCI